MPNSKESLSHELIIAVKETVESMTGVDFELFFDAYLAKNPDQPNLSEQDLIAEILEAGDYQAKDDASFEDAVMIGAFAMGEDLHLF